MRQLSEAQDLKDHVDRREQAVSRVLARCLSPEQHRDYRWGKTSLSIVVSNVINKDLTKLHSTGFETVSKTWWFADFLKLAGTTEHDLSCRSVKAGNASDKLQVWSKDLLNMVEVIQMKVDLFHVISRSTWVSRS